MNERLTSEATGNVISIHQNLVWYFRYSSNRITVMEYSNNLKIVTSNIILLHYSKLILTIVWNSPMRELIGSVMVSSPLLPVFGTLSLLPYFRFPSTFLPSKGRSITTLGTRWHDFFINLFRYFYKIVLFFSLHFFSFS